MVTLLLYENLLSELRCIIENQVAISFFVFVEANLLSPTSAVPAGTCWSLLFC